MAFTKMVLRAEDNAQKACKRLGAEEEMCVAFLHLYRETGKIWYSVLSDGIYHYYAPSTPDLVLLYVLGYEYRQAPLMNEVIKTIQHFGLCLKKMTRKIWEVTAEICKKSGGRCTLRDYLIDSLLYFFHKGSLAKAEIANEEYYPVEFQKIFSTKLWLFQKGAYKLRNIEAYFYQFPLGEDKKISDKKAAADSQLHNRIMQILKSNSGSTSGEHDNQGSLPTENAPSLSDSQFPALYKYIEAFPYGYTRIPTSTDNLLCGLDALSKGITQMHPTLRSPTVSDLQELVASKEYQTTAREFLMKNQKVNSNEFSGDQLANILRLWGEKFGTVLQLGWLTDDGLPSLYPCVNKDAATVVWVHNDDAEAKFQGVFARALFGKVVGHWSALVAKSE